VKNLWKQLDQHLQEFLAEKDFDTKKITAEVMKGKKMIKDLSNKLPG
jgi:hypothetical protein